MAESVDRRRVSQCPTMTHAIGVVLLLMTLLVSVSPTRIAQQKIYKTLQDNLFCFRRLNATHEIGCQFNYDNGNVGVLHLVENAGDVEYITGMSSVGPMIPILPLRHFTRTNLMKFKTSGRVAGVLVLNSPNETIPQVFSPDKACPNDLFDVYKKSYGPEYGKCHQEWTPKNDARGMMFDNWPFPIFLISQNKSIEDLLSCFERFNRQEKQGLERPWPLCSAQLDMMMHAAVNTPVCMRRSEAGGFAEIGTRFCDPLGSKNIFSNLLPATEAPEESVIMVIARLDSFSMFEDISPGVEISTGLVTLLSVAETIAKHKDQLMQMSNGTNIVFAIFDGESFDYIGSSATAFSMSKKTFPQVLATIPSRWSTEIKPPNITLSSFKLILELGQLASHNKMSPDQLVIHFDPVMERESQRAKRVIQDIEAILLREGDKNIRTARSREFGLPPSSIHSFLNERMYIPAIYLANHEQEYTNKYFNSFLDDRTRFNDDFDALLTDRLTSISGFVSKSLVRFIGQDSSDSKRLAQLLQPNRQTIEEVLDCLTRNRTCQLFQDVGRTRFPSKGVLKEEEAIPTYVSVPGNSVRQMLVNYLHRVLGFLTGSEVVGISTENDCLSLRPNNTQVDYFWMIGRDKTRNGTCVKTITYTTNAISPAFYPEETANWTSTKYSTWTESIWSVPTVRIFLQPNPAHEWMVMSLGVLITILSFVAVYYVNANSKTIFLSQPSTARSSVDRNIIEIDT